jgi:hypothetical protein
MCGMASGGCPPPSSSESDPLCVSATPSSKRVRAVPRIESTTPWKIVRRCSAAAAPSYRRLPRRGGRGVGRGLRHLRQSAPVLGPRARAGAARVVPQGPSAGVAPSHRPDLVRQSSISAVRSRSRWQLDAGSLDDISAASV